MRLWVVTALAVALLVPAQAEDVELFMDDATGTVNGLSSVRLLTNETPSGGASTLGMSNFGLPGAPSSATWYSQAWTDDMDINGSVAVTAYFGSSIEVLSTITAELFDIDANGTATSIGSGSASVQLGLLPHDVSISIDPSDDGLHEGHALAIQISVSGVAPILVNFDYAGAGSPSGLAFAADIRDSDGDGFGDSEERRAGTDPNDANSRPSGGGGGGSGGGGDGNIAEPIVATAGLIACLAIAFSGLRRGA